MPATPAEAPSGGAVYQLFAAGDLAVTSTAVDSALAGQPKERMLDGNAATAWSTAGYKAATAQVTLSLAKREALGALRLKTGALAAGTTYDVQVSEDGAAWKTALANQTNATWNMETKAFPAGTAGRHVRLLFRNTTMARLSIYEVGLVAAGSTPAWAPGQGGYFEPYPVPGKGEPEPEPYPMPGTGWGGTGGGSAYYPDLVAIAPSSFYVDTREAGKRIFRFPTAIGNGGPGHLQIRGRIEGNVTRGTQEILDGAGRVIETRDVGTFELHPDHGHFHVSHVARYELRRDTFDGEFVQNGKKISFCMEDSIRIREGSDEARIPECNQTMQGITRGFADVYSANLPDQTFDFTGLASGQYVIAIHLDPGRKFLETNRNNNLAWVKFRYDAAVGKAYRLASYP
ncbi:MAG: lysyl oxidase family protein [Candidatus Sericytochromatia bacterium]